LEKNFTLTASGSDQGLEFVDALPRAGDSQFKKIRIGFANGLPKKMILSDAFGQTTDLTFSDVERNPKLATNLFQFTPPKGADVVGQ
ncbi:MAG TPA: outer-membrane lipoprotein carrier protein LolA, partial [Casimicrobiaceae bacterium]